jgi:molybdate transport system substrate-binding protein
MEIVMRNTASVNGKAASKYLTSRLMLGLLSLAMAGLAQAKDSAEDLTVSAAASLTNAFTEIGKAFEASHPGAHVAFNFAASGPLLQQIAQGAPADVFASADEETLDKAQRQNLIVAGTRVDFAANTLVLIVPSTVKSAPVTVDELLGASYKRIAIGNLASVPAGRYAKESLDLAGIGARLEQKLIPADSVRQVLSYVARGEVDAGFVYATDAAIEKDKVKVAAALNTRTPIRYPIAQVSASRHAELALAFIAYVQNAESRATLNKYGFTAP